MADQWVDVKDDWVDVPPPSAPAPTARGSAADVARGQMSDAKPSDPLWELNQTGVGPSVGIPATGRGDPLKVSPAQLEARMRHAAQTASWGGIDEAVGFGQALVGKGSGKFWDRFRENRNAWQARDDASAAAEPDDATFGRVAGAAVMPGAGAKTAGKRLLVGLAEGGVQGALRSRGDLTKGEVGKVAGDSLIDSIFGAAAAAPGAAGAYSKSGAAETSRAAAVAGRMAEPVSSLKDQVLKRLTRPAAAAAEVVDKAITAVPRAAVGAGRAALAVLDRAVKKGSPTAALVQDAMASGVTEREIRQALQGARE